MSNPLPLPPARLALRSPLPALLLCLIAASCSGAGSVDPGKSTQKSQGGAGSGEAGSGDGGSGDAGQAGAGGSAAGETGAGGNPAGTGGTGGPGGAGPGGPGGEAGGGAGGEGGGGEGGNGGEGGSGGGDPFGGGGGVTSGGAAGESPCAPSLLKRSYIGCDYFPTVTSNAGLYDGFSFAVAVANTSQADAHVQIVRGVKTEAAGTVKAGELGVFKLPWVNELRHSFFSIMSSALVPQGAYHLKTDQPVIAYQFNPLEYEVPQTGFCLDPQFTGKCFSYTNDASMLLPVTALGTEYLVASRGAIGRTTDSGTLATLPGLVAITAVQDKTTVKVTSSAHVRGGAGVQAMQPGGAQTFVLNAGDVVQLLTGDATMSDTTGCEVGIDGSQTCQLTGAFDLTGTLITSDLPVAVVGGHDCAFVPYNKPACDHLEETIFPLTTWGKEVLVAPPQSVQGAPQNSGVPDAQIVRVISGADGNLITLDPPIPGASVGTLNKGEFVDLPATSLDFAIKGTGPLLAVQHMLGGDIVDPGNAGTSKSKGDPSMSLAVPSEQFRTEYLFLAPVTYTYSFVNVIAPADAAVTLDGAPLSGPSPAPVGGSGYVVTRKAIPGGPHSLKADKPFGIVVYGYGTYTSYMYPGGLDLDDL